jgi:uncharacterized coiled-coil DUF342 family protein
MKTQQDIINENIIQQYEIRVQQDIDKIKDITESRQYWNAEAIKQMELVATLQGQVVDVTLERDELDEQYKMAVADRNTCRAMYKETLQERDGWISEYRAAREEVERLKEKLTVYENQWEPSKQEQIDSFSEKFDQLDEEYQDLVRIATCLYKADKEAIREMINEGLGGDNYEKFKTHLGV